MLKFNSGKKIHPSVKVNGKINWVLTVILWMIIIIFLVALIKGLMTAEAQSWFDKPLNDINIGDLLIVIMIYSYLRKK